ncbi:zinc-binding dehydrogenase [Aerosakkonema sp. BLCC-F183]|uniref:zinc-binding dehydrogenase n=1 Tax=Aerosakkonema sp. BLCC-F183 TaxID=3342834 RepID=UPI0035B9B161
MLYTQESPHKIADSLRVRLRVVRSLLDLTNPQSEANSLLPIPVIGRVIESTAQGVAVDSLVLAPGNNAPECSVSAAACLPLEAGTDENAALLAGIAAPALAAMRRVNFEIGVHAVVLGLNLYGLLLVSTSRLGGAGNLSALDARESRRAYAEKLGAGRVASPEEPGWPEALVQGSSRGGADVVFVTGNEAGLVEAILPKCRKEARVLVLASMPAGAIDLYHSIHSPGRTLLGPQPQTEPGQQWVTDAGRLLRLAQAGRYRPEGIIGERVKASEATANSTSSTSLTVVLDWES